MRRSTADMLSEESLREMMRAAAATASAAAGDASVAAAAVTTSEATRYVRHSAGRSSANRRQSISMLPPTLGGDQFRQGAPLPPFEGGVRWKKIQAVAREIAAKWTHPQGSSQYETETLHHVRAILYMNKSLITQSFVSHVSGVSQGSLSHYVRGLFRGNQKNVDDRLSNFVQKFSEGSLDKFLEEARSGTRPIGRPAFYDALNIAAAAGGTTHRSKSSSAITPALPTPVTDSRPPVPPPPPPQLQPAPWTHPPQPQPAFSTPALSPVSKTSPQSNSTETDKTPDTDKPNDKDLRIPASVKSKRAEERKLSERARRAQLRAQKTRPGKRPRPVFPPIPEEKEEPTSVLAVERAYQALVAPKWTGDLSNTEPLLVPIELYVTIGDHTLHMYTQWDVSERQQAPELVAEQIRRARGLPEQFVNPIALQIRRRLFDAGMICPPPPGLLDAENRRLIKIVVELRDGDKMNVLRDEFEWDLGTGSLNSPELFARLLCTDANISQNHAATVARALRKKLVCAHAIAYGDDEMRILAEKELPPDDPIRKRLPSLISAVVKCTAEDIRLKDREENELTIRSMFVRNLLDSIPSEIERRKAERERKVIEDNLRQELQSFREKELELLSKRNDELEEVRKEVDEEALQVYQERNLDFRPYLKLRVARGESPSLWMPAAFDRRRRKQLTFPMTQPSRKNSGHGALFSRPSKRKRSRSHREASEKTRERTPIKSEQRSTKKAKFEQQAGKSISVEDYKRVTLKIRIRDPNSKISKHSLSKRRR